MNGIIFLMAAISLGAYIFSLAPKSVLIVTMLCSLYLIRNNK